MDGEPNVPGEVVVITKWRRSRAGRTSPRARRLAGALVALAAAAGPGAAAAGAAETYRNPLPITVPGAGTAETWADPAVIRGTDGAYYAYATSDPLSSSDRDAMGALRVHRIPMARSTDLVHWTYVGDAFASVPAWLAPTSGLWAPDVRRFGGRYLLYYTATDTADAISGEPGCDGDSAIGVATAPTPTGPWTDSGGPVVAPRRGASGTGCDFLWTFDPAVVKGPRAGERYLYYGSYNGGVEARRLTDGGLRTDPGTATRIAPADRYEGSYVIRRHGWYWYFGSATDCCRGPLTGYSVFTGRSRSPVGPFVDRLGVPLTDPRVGGTPVISMNGNRWVGTGHNAVIRDAAGQDWFVYHAIDRTDPLLAEPNPNRINKRPMLLDRLDWVGGWPSVRAGRWASDRPQPVPVTAAGGKVRPVLAPRPDDAPGRALRGPSDEFAGGAAKPRWSWVRTPAASLTARPGWLRFPTQAGDIAEGSNDASLFTERAPRGDFMVETKFEFDLPPTGVFNFQQAGMAIYADDDRFVKLAHVAIGQTRQTEWAKEVAQPAGPTGQRYGNTVVGPPGLPGALRTTTWLRIVRRGSGAAEQRYTAYSSIDGRRWVRGGTWTHSLGRARIALFAFGGTGHTADFDYVRVYRVTRQPAAASQTRAVTGVAARAAPLRPVHIDPAFREAYSNLAR
jgi:arabinan endo-1,5-alpha-L-arabinosidase